MKPSYLAPLVLLAGGAQAQFAFQASLTPDITLHGWNSEVWGLSICVWGENPQKGLALGMVNGSDGHSKGFSWSLFANYAESYTGMAIAPVNICGDVFVGCQLGVVNISNIDLTGLQIGVVNVGEDIHGFQIGLVNYADMLSGVQIGLVNLAHNNGWFEEFPNKLATGFPIANWSF